jgi:Cu/Ag efflux protein CusF
MLAIAAGGVEMSSICFSVKWRALLALAALLFVAVCVQAGHLPLGQASTELPKYFCGKGEVISVDDDLSGVTIKHERIEGFMEAMTMHFKTESAEIARGIKPGDFVRFTLKDTSEKTRLVYIEKIEPPKRDKHKR